MTPEAIEKVREIFAEPLDQRYAGELEFDPIIVKPDVDSYRDANLLDAEWNGTLIRQVRYKMADSGITEFPSPSFISDSEYRYFSKRGKVGPLWFNRRCQGSG